MSATVPWPSHVLFLSHTAQTGSFRVGSHHLARELARAGHTVTHLTTPVTLAHVLRLRRPDTLARLRLGLAGVDDADGVHHRVALAPLPLEPRAPRALAAASDAAARRIMARQLRDRPKVDVAIVDQPLFTELLDEVDASVVVYRATDLYPEGRVRAAERRLLARADAVVATSGAIWQALEPSLARPVPSLVLRNGVEWRRFAQEGSPRRTDVVYVGALDQRLDWATVRDLAAGHPDVPFLLFGPVDQAPAAVLPANVRLAGALDYASVPQALAQARVGLLPLSDDPTNEGRSPMKYYEYLAAGAYVVGRRTTTLADQGAPGVFLYASHQDAETQLRRALEAAAPNSEGRAFARRYDWAERARVLGDFLQGLARCAQRPRHA